MTEALAGLAEQGLGVAWLPDSSFGPGPPSAALVPAGDASWDVEVLDPRVSREGQPAAGARHGCGTADRAPMSTRRCVAPHRRMTN